MNEFARRFGLSLLLVCAGSSAAQADGMSDLQKKLDGALKSAKSFVISTRYPAQAYASSLTFVAPNRTRVSVAVAATTTDVITIGQTLYSSKNGAPFEKSPVGQPSGAPPPAVVGSVKVSALEPDITVEGVTYGAFDTIVSLDKPVTLACRYTKHDFRLVRCTNGEVSQSYTSYNDPANIIEAPPGAVDSPKVDAPKDVK